MSQLEVSGVDVMDSFIAKKQNTPVTYRKYALRFYFLILIPQTSKRQIEILLTKNQIRHCRPRVYVYRGSCFSSQRPFRKLQSCDEAVIVKWWFLRPRSTVKEAKKQNNDFVNFKRYCVSRESNHRKTKFKRIVCTNTLPELYEQIQSIIFQSFTLITTQSCK